MNTSMKAGMGVVGLVLWAAGMTDASAQGSLTPPGPPAPMMKTLAQVEPRTPISSAPVTISQPGSYYLTANLTGTVTIAAHNVTLDLMGFTVMGTTWNAVGSMLPGATNATVRNGTLCAPNGNGLDLGGAGCAMGLVERVRVSGCGFHGLTVGSGFLVRECEVTGCGVAGISGPQGTDVRACHVVSNGTGLALGGGSRAIGNTIVSNRVAGLKLTGSGSHVAGNIVWGNGDNYDLSAGNRLDLLISEIPERLDQSCSARLAGSLNLNSDGHGVVITASGVTLDLMGFTLTGNTNADRHGVFLDGSSDRPLQDVVVRNGIVRGFSYGVRAVCSMGSRFEHLVVASNLAIGVYFDGSHGRCDGNTLADCTIRSNDHGVALFGFCGRCNGNTIARCTIVGNDTAGIALDGYCGHCDGNTVTDCSVTGNEGHGICLESRESGICSRNAIEKCHVMDNTGRGIYLDGHGGVCEGNLIRDCAIGGNADIGLSLYYANGNRLQGNHCQGQTGATTYGLQTASCEKNLVLGNTCIGHTFNFSLDADDTYGPIVTDVGPLPTTGAGAHPWANFAR